MVLSSPVYLIIYRLPIYHLFVIYHPSIQHPSVYLPIYHPSTHYPCIIDLLCINHLSTIYHPSTIYLLSIHPSIYIFIHPSIHLISKLIIISDYFISILVLERTHQFLGLLTRHRVYRMKQEEEHEQQLQILLTCLCYWRCMASM